MTSVATPTPAPIPSVEATSPPGPPSTPLRRTTSRDCSSPERGTLGSAEKERVLSHPTPPPHIDSGFSPPLPSSSKSQLASIEHLVSPIQRRYKKSSSGGGSRSTRRHSHHTKSSRRHTRRHTLHSASSSPTTLQGVPYFSKVHRTGLVGTIYALHPQMVINKLKPIQNDMLHYVESQKSISQLSFSVNDSAANKTFDDCYAKESVLGEGGFATVHRCLHYERQHHYAVKEVHQSNYECSGENLKEEIDALKRLRDVPYIVRLLDVFEEYDVCYMVMEEMKGGDLLSRLCEVEVFPEVEARRISRKLLEALYFCHKKHIVHRDIKPENILLVSEDSNDIKLADFGCARRFSQRGRAELKTLCGSPQYVAPELYTHEGGYDERCDLWSAGVVIYVMLGGYAPFDGEDHTLPGIICEGHYEFHRKYWSNISEDAKSLIKSLLLVEPHRRASIEGALDGAWLRRKDRDSVQHRMSLDASLSSFEAWCAASHHSGGLAASQALDHVGEEVSENSTESLQPGDF